MTVQSAGSTRNNEPGKIEAHGSDFVPDNERRGSPRSLFAVWAGANVTYLYFVLGGLMVLFGLDVAQAIGVIIAGNLVWVGVGYLAVSGPTAGSPSTIIGRAFFGVHGNRLVSLVRGWLVGVLYEAINLAVGALAAFALVELFLGQISGLAKFFIIMGLAVTTFSISVYGHATIMKLSPWFTWVLLAALAVLAWFVIGEANFSYVPEGGALTGTALWATAAAGFAIIASAPLSWPVGADYSRYLPATASPKKVAFWTAVGGFLPAAGIAILGVLAGTVIDMVNPQVAMAAIVPAWFYPVFLLVIIIGSIANNAVTAYSTGLALLAVGVPWRRSVTIIFDAVIAIGVTLYALFISDFIGTLSGVLEVTIAILSPSMAIYAVDIYLRRNRYNGPSLQDTSRTSRYWFFGGFNVGGMSALLIATTVAFFCINTTFWVGPLVNVLGGADISVFVGSILGGGIYALIEGRRIRESSAAEIPASEASTAAARATS